MQRQILRNDRRRFVQIRMATMTKRRVPELATFEPWNPDYSETRGISSVTSFSGMTEGLRRRFHLHVVALDRRQVLEHHVPLPALHGIARLQPVLQRQRPVEGLTGETLEARRSAMAAAMALRTSCDVL